MVETPNTISRNTRAASRPAEIWAVKRDPSTELYSALEFLAMLKTGLEFAPGTTDASKRVIGRMFQPGDLFEAYRQAKDRFGTGDIVLAASDQGPEIQYMTRLEYGKHLKQIFGARASEFKMWSNSAQSVVKLPADSNAFWLIVDLHGADMPIMCVIFAVPFEVGDHVEAPSIN